MRLNPFSVVVPEAEHFREKRRDIFSLQAESPSSGGLIGLAFGEASGYITAC
jgi:hypothetical protein